MVELRLVKKIKCLLCDEECLPTLAYKLIVFSTEFEERRFYQICDDCILKRIDQVEPESSKQSILDYLDGNAGNTAPPVICFEKIDGEWR